MQNFVAMTCKAGNSMSLAAPMELFYFCRSGLDGETETESE